MVIFYRSRCNIDIDTTDRSIFMFDTVDRFDTVQNIFDRIVYRIFSRFDRQSFMSHILQGGNFFYDLLLRQLLSGNMFILPMIRAVYTAVHTVVG